MLLLYKHRHNPSVVKECVPIIITNKLNKSTIYFNQHRSFPSIINNQTPQTAEKLIQRAFFAVQEFAIKKIGRNKF
jgi:hypothetical protein